MNENTHFKAFLNIQAGKYSSMVTSVIKLWLYLLLDLCSRLDISSSFFIGLVTL